MYKILSSTPMDPVDGHVDATYTDRSGWSEDMGVKILPMMLGDDQAGPFVVLSYAEPSDEQMPLSFAHSARVGQLADLGAGHHQHGP